MNLAGIYGITGCSTINDQFLQFGRIASVYLTTTSTQATHNYTIQASSDTSRLLLLRGVQSQCSCWTMSTTLCLWFPFPECHMQSLENAATSLSLQSLSFAHALFKIKKKKHIPVTPSNSGSALVCPAADSATSMNWKIVSTTPTTGDIHFYIFPFQF